MESFVTTKPLADAVVDDSEARAAWNSFTKPVTEEAFVAWYLANVKSAGSKGKKKKNNKKKGKGPKKGGCSSHKRATPCRDADCKWDNLKNECQIWKFK